MKLRNPRFQGSILDFSNRRKSRPKEKRIKKVAHCLEDKIPKNNFVLDFHQSSMMGLMKLLSIGFHTFFFGSYWYPGCVESLTNCRLQGSCRRLSRPLLHRRTPLLAWHFRSSSVSSTRISVRGNHVPEDQQQVCTAQPFW